MVLRVVVMGVAGCGKSSVGEAVAVALGASYEDGDDLHPKGPHAEHRDACTRAQGPVHQTGEEGACEQGLAAVPCAGEPEGKLPSTSKTGDPKLYLKSSIFIPQPVKRP